jgi:hypothetical protein
LLSRAAADRSSLCSVVTRPGDCSHLRGVITQLTREYANVQTAIIYTFSFTAGQTFTLTYWTNDWGTFNAYQAAPSLNQGFNAGAVSMTVEADMPVSDPNNPGLFYTLRVTNDGDPNLNPSQVTMCDIYNAWQ